MIVSGWLEACRAICFCTDAVPGLIAERWLGAVTKYALMELVRVCRVCSEYAWCTSHLPFKERGEDANAHPPFTWPSSRSTLARFTAVEIRSGI